MKMLPKLHPLLKKDFKAGEGIKIDNNEISVNVGDDIKLDDNKLCTDIDFGAFTENYEPRFYIQNRYKKIVIKQEETKLKLEEIRYIYGTAKGDFIKLNGKTYPINNGNFCVESIHGMHYEFTGADIITLDLKGLPFEDIVFPGYPNNMFYLSDMNKLKQVEFGKSDFNHNDLTGLFNGCNSIEHVNLSPINFLQDIRSITTMFAICCNLQSINLGNMKISNNTTSIGSAFRECYNLNYITCTSNFKDFCITNAERMMLPKAMLPGGSGTWEIID